MRKGDNILMCSNESPFLLANTKLNRNLITLPSSKGQRIIGVISQLAHIQSTKLLSTKSAQVAVKGSGKPSSP